MKLVLTKEQLVTHFQTQMSYEIKEVVIEGLPIVATGDSNLFNPNILPISIGKYLQQGNLIGAIKEARTLYGLGLKEAKDYCEMYYYRTPSY